MSDVRQVVKQLVNELRRANQLIYLDNLAENALWLHTACDKGGKTTKLILQVINQQNRHSMDNAKLIGYFEGKDNRVNLEAVFGPLLTSLQTCCENISQLQLLRPPPPPTHGIPACRDHQKCDGKRKELILFSSKFTKILYFVQKL